MRKGRFVGYLRAIGIVYASVAAVLAMNWVFLWRTGEHRGLPAIIDEQMVSDGLYNGLFAYLDYKAEAYRRRMPEVVVLGSSLALQIREYAFTVPFYNLGGSVRSQDETFRVSDRFFRSHRPSTVILVLDFWHFCRVGVEGSVRRPAKRGDFGHRAVPLITAPAQILRDGIIGAKEFVDVLSGHYDRLTPITRIGVNAIVGSHGAAADGSHHYNLSGDLAPISERVKSSLNFLSKEVDVFLANCQLAERQIEMTAAFVREMADEGTKVIPVIPPMPPAIADAMVASGKFRYVESWRRLMAAQLPSVRDFWDVRPLGGSDCEFVDYIHGGEVAYLRVLRALGLAPADPLWGRVNVELVDRLIAQYSGGVTVGFNRIGEAYRQRIDQQFEACRGSNSARQ